MRGRRANKFGLLAALTLCLSLPAAAQAGTTITGKVKGGGTCSAQTTVSPNSFGLTVPACSREIKRVTAEGLLMQNNQIPDYHRFPAGPAPYSESYTSSQTGNRVRMDFRIQLKTTRKKLVQWRKRSGGDKCRVVTTRRASDTLLCSFIENV